MQQSPPFNDMICSTAERILKSLSPEGSPPSKDIEKRQSLPNGEGGPASGSPSPKAEGRSGAAVDSSETGPASQPAKRGETTSWDIKMRLHLSSSTLYLALGWLCSQGRVTMEPYELTYRVRLSEAGSPQVKQPPAQHETQPIG